MRNSMPTYVAKVMTKCVHRHVRKYIQIFGNLFAIKKNCWCCVRIYNYDCWQSIVVYKWKCNFLFGQWNICGPSQSINKFSSMSGNCGRNAPQSNENEICSGRFLAPKRIPSIRMRSTSPKLVCMKCNKNALNSKSIRQSIAIFFSFNSTNGRFFLIHETHKILANISAAMLDLIKYIFEEKIHWFIVFERIATGWRWRESVARLCRVQQILLVNNFEFVH